MYYRQKGQRTPTRLQAIHENFDLCAEALVQRLTSYKTQAEEYHNSCIQGKEEWEKKKEVESVSSHVLSYGQGFLRRKLLIENPFLNHG